MDVAAHLRKLQIRAGEPSIRDIERLIARQDRQRPMARSTIQDKLSGRSPLNLTQTLSIVEALGEYARVNGAPLPQQELTHGYWRELVTSATGKKRSIGTSIETSDSQDTLDIRWNLDPLRQAEMHDLVQIVESSQDEAISSWLPKVLREMMRAEMSVTGFIKTATEDTPQGIVQTISALADEFPNADTAWDSQPWAKEEHKKTVGSLIGHTARRHGNVSSPAIIAGLRRANNGDLVNLYLIDLGTWLLPATIDRVVKHLRMAALNGDANRLLTAVGRKRKADRLFEVVKHFEEEGNLPDRNRVLRSVGTEDSLRMQAVARHFGQVAASEEILRELARGIDYGKHEDFAQSCALAGLEDFAHIIREVADEPPF
jgi:hypothetical protein